MKKIFLFLAFIICIGTSCKVLYPQKKISGNYNKESECLGLELDGSQTIKAWGTGRGRGDAISQAKKNAVRDVLFNGIRNGKQECNQKPIIFEVNAQEKYEDYFNQFFKDGGIYENFISMKDEPIKGKLKDWEFAVDQIQYGVIVRVLRAELKTQMINDKILLPINN
jgi:hypothetical protein